MLVNHLSMEADASKALTKGMLLQCATCSNLNAVSSLLHCNFAAASGGGGGVSCLLHTLGASAPDGICLAFCIPNPVLCLITSC